jgi:glycosyltransferase involved in cell wall biosynthesis
MSRTNVLWVIDHVCYDGTLHGGGRLYWNILPRLNPDRIHVVACMLRASEEIRQLFAESPFPVRILDKAKFDPTTLWTFLRLIKEENIQVMHLHCYASSTFGRLVGLLTHVPTIIHDYDTEVYFPYPSYLSLADRLLAPTTDGAVAASPMVKNFLIQKRKIATNKIRMMLHAVPSEKYGLIAERKTAKVRHELNVPENSHVIGTITKLGPQRGNEDLLRALALVVTDLPNTTLFLIYKVTRFHRLPSRKYVEVAKAHTENQVSELQQLAKELGIESNVRFLEWPDNIDEFVATCDVVVAPFHSERFSSVNLLEAMAQGKPVVATDRGEPREIVRNGINGYLFPPGDVAALGGAIKNLLSDPARLQQLSRQAKLAAEQYSVDAYARTLEKWYGDLASLDPQRANVKEVL